MRRGRIAAMLVLAITLAAAPVAAHMAPSVDDNNRYLKVSPAAGRVRVAYTVFFGEVPGAGARRTIDTNGDGRISEAEGQVFGDKLAAEVADSLEITVDGATRPVTWSLVSVGMGTPVTAAGAFSIDLVSWLCLSPARGPHAVRIRDRFRIPRPGETEVKVEDRSGITVHHTRIGAAAAGDGAHQFRFVGPGGPLAEDGLDLAFTVGDEAPLATDGTCAGASTPERRAIPTAVILGAAAVLAFVLAAGVVLVQRRRARPGR